MKRTILLTIVIALWLAFVPLSKALMQSQDTVSNEASLASEEICAGTAVPAGWIVTNKTALSYRCGVSNQPIGSPIYNIWTIEKISDLYVGDRVVACDGAAPADWIVIERQAVDYRCGIGQQPIFGAKVINVMVIERVNGRTRPPGPGPNRSPIGTLESIDYTNRTATGWSLDPDSPQSTIYVNFYVDGPAGNTQGSGTYIGQAVASQPRLDVNQNTGYPGNHGFTFSIPTQYQNCTDHTLYVYGLDTITLAERYLSGSPRPFKFCPTPTGRRTAFDFNNDQKADIAIYRPSTREWWIDKGSDGLTLIQFGLSTDIIAPADYDGDGKTDIALFRPSDGNWYITKSTGGTDNIHFGQFGDYPVPADYNGDGRAELAVYRPEALGKWYIRNSDTGQYSQIVQFGAGTDLPVPADYNGDGKAELAVYRPGELSYWFILNSATGQYTTTQFGVGEDQTVQGDYDGDGKTDIAVFRPSSGLWFIHNAATGQYSARKFGTSTDKPVPADYDGDGKIDIAFYRPSEGNWYIQQPRKDISIIRFGMAEDKPIPSAFVH